MGFFKDQALALVARQLGRPSGPGGVIVGRLMTRWNRIGNELALDALELAPSDRVLEIGFGPGAALGPAAARAHRGVVAGIDISPQMVRAAKRRHRDLIAAGRMELCCAGMEAIPYPDAAFDKLFLVAALYFLKNPEACFAEARRVLAPGGRMAVVFVMPSDFAGGQPLPIRFYTPDELTGLLAGAGFRDSEMLAPRLPFHCMTARA